MGSKAENKEKKTLKYSTRDRGNWLRYLLFSVTYGDTNFALGIGRGTGTVEETEKNETKFIWRERTNVELKPKLVMLIGSNFISKIPNKV